jgi:sulfur carrier protein ThiS
VLREKRKPLNPKLERRSKMKVMFINNDGGGFADYVEVADGTTVGQFFVEKMPGMAASDILIRVNRQPVPADAVLHDGDRVTMTPVKIEGAAWRA